LPLSLDSNKPHGNSAPAIHVSEVTFRYSGSDRGIESLNLTIKQGERVALLGPNGAGKSTLIMLLAGLVSPAKGAISLHGDPVDARNTAFRRHLGVVFQDPNDQLFCPTLFDDVAFGPRNMGLPREEISHRVHDALSAVGLHGFENRSPLHLSLGERKRAALATVLSMRPSILALDEPTSGMDPRGCRETGELLQRLASDLGHTLIIATHDLTLAVAITERALLMHQGQLIADMSTRELVSSHALLHEHGMA